MKLYSVGLAAILSCLLVTGSAAQESSVVIGAMYNLTGGQRLLDVPSARGAELAVAEANKAGGLLGQPVKLNLVDGHSQPEVIAKEAAELVNEEPAVAGLIGFSDTDMVLAAAPIAAKHKRVFLTSGATSPRLPQQVPEYLFLACFGDNVQAAAGAEWAYNQLKARTAVVFYNETTSYTQLLRGYFETSFGELGGKVLTAIPYAPGNLAAKALMLPKADLVYLAASPGDVAIAIPALRDAGISVPILGGDGLDIGVAWKDVREARNVYFTTHAHVSANNPDPRVKKFREAYAKAYPGTEPDAFTALGYDAARLMIAAIKTANSTEPEAVRKALAETTDFQGVTGTISYRDGSRIPVKAVSIISIDGGKMIFLGGVMPKNVPAP